MSQPSFRKFPLPLPLLEAIEAAGYQRPTPVQAATVPAMSEGDDLIIQAQTGTGKTAAFTIPILAMLEKRPGVLQTLILVPTRELARQVADEFQKLGAGLGIASCAVYGGASIEDQAKALKTAQVVAATPGRLLDLVRRKAISFQNLRFFGLDEADEMLSMGFERDVFEIARMLPEDRQNFLCSATIDDAVGRLATNFMSDPKHLNLSSDALGAKSIEHIFFEVKAPEKLAALRRILDLHCKDGALIFANTRAATFLLQRELAADGYSVGVLNGELAQSERERALADMRGDNLRYLVVTDVAARGIDISGLPAVVNFELPDAAETYVHRTGRTGRAGQFGAAYSLVAPGDIAVRHALQKVFKLPIQHRSTPTEEDRLAERADRQLSALLDKVNESDLPYATRLPLAKRLATRKDGERWIARLLALADAAQVTSSDSAMSSLREIDAPKAPDVPPAPQAVEPLHVEHAEKYAPEEVPTEVPQESTPLWQDDSASIVDRTRSLLLDTSDGHDPARFRTTGWIARKLDVDAQDLDGALAESSSFERRPNARPMWRVVDGADAAPSSEGLPEPAQEAPATAPAAAAVSPDASVTTDQPGSSDERNEDATIFDLPSEWVELFVAISKDAVGDENALRSVLAELGGLDDEDFGTISIRPNFAFVRVRDIYADDLITAAHGASAFNTELVVELSRKELQRRQERAERRS